MQIGFTTRNVVLTDDLREQSERMARRLSRFHDRIISAEYTFEKQKRGVGGDLVVKVSGKRIVAKAQAGDIRSTLDQLYEKAERQLKKHRALLSRSAERHKASTKDIAKVVPTPDHEEPGA
jgi:ribosomal subunit interface protein